MEKVDKLAGERIHTRKIGTFAEIAAVTGQGQIIRLVAAAVLFGDDVFDVMS